MPGCPRPVGGVRPGTLMTVPAVVPFTEGLPDGGGVVHPVDVAGAVPVLVAAADRYAAKPLAPNPRLAYASDWARFSADVSSGGTWRCRPTRARCGRSISLQRSILSSRMRRLCGGASRRVTQDPFIGSLDLRTAWRGGPDIGRDGGRLGLIRVVVSGARMLDRIVTARASGLMVCGGSRPG